MLDFKAKMHQIQFRLGLRPIPRWGSLQRFPIPPSWIKGSPRLREGEGEEWGKGRERKERGREIGGGSEGRGEGEGRDRAPKLLLNQGPSEPCYATICGRTCV